MAVSLFGVVILIFTPPMAYAMLWPFLYRIASICINSTFGLWVVVMLQCVTFIGSAIISARFLARMRPITLSMNNKSPKLHYGSSGTEPFVVGLCACLFISNIQSLSAALHLKLAIPFPSLIFDITFIVLCVARQETAKSVLSSDAPPIVLFLRPFASFADKSLLSAVLNSVPADSQVVFLVPMEESQWCWDPFTLGMAGFQAMSPITSMPIPIVCLDDEWIDGIAFLIGISRLVVMDLSIMTPSLETEVSLLAKLHALNKTIAVFDTTTSAKSNTELARNATFGLAVLADYRRRLDIPRILGSLLLASIIFRALWAVLGGAPRNIVSFVYGSFDTAWNALVSIVGLSMMVVGLYFWRSLLLKRTVQSSDIQSIAALEQEKSLSSNVGARLHITLFSLLGLVVAVFASYVISSPHAAVGDTIFVRNAFTLINDAKREDLLLDYIVDKFRLRIISPIRSRDEIPKTDRSKIVIANVRNILHFRIFDPDGSAVIDTDELQITDNPSLATLKARLTSLRSIQTLPPTDEYHIISEVLRIVGPSQVNAKIIKREASWSVVPNTLRFALSKMDVEPSHADWFNRRDHSEEGLKIGYEGFISIPAGSAPGEISLYFSLPEQPGLTSEHRRLRLLLAGIPEDDRSTNTRPSWLLKTWTVHETRPQAMFAWLMDFIKGSGIAVGTVIGTIAGLKVLKK